MKGQMLGSRSLEDDLSLAHSAYANSLQSQVSGRKYGGAGPPHPRLMISSQLTSLVLPVVATGSVQTNAVLLLGPLAPLGFHFFFHQERLSSLWDWAFCDLTSGPKRGLVG